MNTTPKKVGLADVIEDVAEAGCHVEVSILSGEYRECLTAIYTPGSTSNKLRELLRKWEQMLP